MDYNLIEKKFIDKWREYIKNYRIYSNQLVDESLLKREVKCPYKKLKTRGSTYPKTGGGFVMGLTLEQLARAIGFNNHWLLHAYLISRNMPKPDIEVTYNDKKVKIYDSDTAKKVSEYILYSYKKPSKLIKSYNEYTKGNNK